MSRNLSAQQTSEYLEASNERTAAAYPRLLAFGYFGAVFIAMIGWLAFIAWILWKLIDWAFG